jgi:hypothetical protein
VLLWGVPLGVGEMGSGEEEMELDNSFLMSKYVKTYLSLL